MQDDKSVISFRRGPFATVDMGLPGDHEGQTAVRVFFVMGKDKTALIDSGLFAGYPSLQRGFEELGLDLKALDLLLLTHEHMDHVGNNGALKRASGCTILGHRARADRVADNMLNATTIVHAFPEGEGFDLGSEYLDWMGPEPGPIDAFLEDGSTIDLGGVVLEVIGLPGHSAAEIGFFEPNERVLIIADPLLPAFNPVLYLYEDPAEMRRTFDKLERLIRERGVELVLLAHDDPQTGEQTLALIDDCRRRVDKVEASILANIESHPGIGFAALRDKVCDDNGKVREWRALVSIDASLRAFEAQGRIRRDGNGWASA
ncbi:MBL fold metallo-hydrolase [Devosia ginsengisoli]|nr:MBL fold metallo-hydrolase [Devosia ginsengisoli]